MNKITKFIVGAVAALAIFGFAASANAAYTHMGTLKLGMSSSQVMSLQQTLNADGFLVSTTGAGSPGMESSFFGPKTKAAVIAFQTAKGLGADGIVGPQTGTALAAMTGGAVSGNFPAGCTSAAGYSTTTGQPCAALPSLPAGCTSTAGYSPVTGAPCSSTGNSGSTGGVLTGGAGSATYTLLGSPSNNQTVGEGQTGTKVLGFSVEADSNSDLNVKSIKLNLNPGSVLSTTGYAGSGSSSTQFQKYADTVNVWYGSTKVASAPASDFNDDSNNNYIKTLSFTSDAIVKKGQTGDFYITVDGASSIDSANLAKKWAMDVTNVRWVDAQGAVVTEDPSTATRTFTFDSFASANSVELRLSEANDNPNAAVVKADATNATDGVVLLKGTLKAVGSDLKVRSVKAVITPSGTGDASEIASQYTLKINGQVVESVDSASCDTAANCNGSATATAATYTFNDNDVTISEGDTVDIELLADINKIDGTTVVGGDGLTAAITADTTNMNVRDSSNSDLTNSELTGSLNGNTQSFFTKGIAVTAGSMSSSATAQTSGNSGTYVIKFSVTAIDEDVYLDKTFASSTSTSADADSHVAVVNGSGTVRATAFSAALASSDNNSTEKTNTFKISDGQTATFTLTVSESGHSELDRAVLYGLEWGTADSASSLGNIYTSNMGVNGDYKTNYVYVGV